MDLWDRIKMALCQCIQDHGPIDRYFVGSAAKRIVREILKGRQSSDTPQLDAMLVSTMDVFHLAEISKLKRDLLQKNKELKETLVEKEALQQKFDEKHTKFCKSQEDLTFARNKVEKINKRLTYIKMYRPDLLHHTYDPIPFPDWMG